MKNEKNKKDFKVPVKFNKKTTDPIELRAFLFNKRKELLESTLVKKDEAAFKTKVETKNDVFLLVTPDNK